MEHLYLEAINARICVVCGSEQSITKEHFLATYYRRHSAIWQRYSEWAQCRESGVVPMCGHTNLWLSHATPEEKAVALAEMRQLSVGGSACDAIAQRDGNIFDFLKSRESKARSWLTPVSGGRYHCADSEENIQTAIGIGMPYWKFGIPSDASGLILSGRNPIEAKVVVSTPGHRRPRYVTKAVDQKHLGVSAAADIVRKRWLNTRTKRKNLASKARIQRRFGEELASLVSGDMDRAIEVMGLALKGYDAKSIPWKHAAMRCSRFAG